MVAEKLHIRMFFDLQAYEYVIQFTDTDNIMREVGIKRHDIAALLEQFRLIIDQTNIDYPEE